MVESLKRVGRVIEAALTPRRSALTFAGHEFRFVRSIWWHDAHQASFDSEIAPYFATLRSQREYRRICDIGAATGLFSVAACARFRSGFVHAFEPSARQRILLRRNTSLNGYGNRIDVIPEGLWNASGTMAFRTHGAISSLRSSTGLPATLDFGERVLVSTLDDWARRRAIIGIDLIKMDIEGAELEAIEGAKATLLRDRPELLIQAYHVRDGARTFDRCATVLREMGYQVREAPASAGLLHAVAT
jgi:FkbM family methyltransferase